MGEYMSQENKKFCDKKEAGCNVYITVICGEKKKSEEHYGKCSYQPEEKKEMFYDGCNVNIIVKCDSEKNDRD